ncbi:glycosyltransferase [Chloroflexota bacterium]
MVKVLTQKNKRMKILFIPTWYPSEVNPLGAIFIKEHASAASLYNDVVVLYAYPDPSPRLWKLYQISEGIEDGIRTIRVKYRYYEGIFTYFKKLIFKDGSVKQGASPSATDKLIGVLNNPIKIPRVVVRESLYYCSIFAAFRRLVKEGWKPDIIHAHIFTAAVPAVLLGKLYRIPVIVTEHYSFFPLRKLSFYERVKARFAMNRARMILPVSNALKEAIEAYGIRNEFQIVPNVVDTEMFYPLSQENKGGDRKKLLLVAGLTPVKGVPYLLQALAQVRQKRRDFILDIVGYGANRGEYEELARKLGLETVVYFHGLKPKEEVAEFMRTCDFLTLPSLYETFGAVVVEALASGKPVVASDIGGIKEIINRDLGVLAPPGNINRLQQAIEFMLDHYVDYPPGKLSMYAKERFGYESGGKLLNSIYCKVKKQRRSI